MKRARFRIFSTTFLAALIAGGIANATVTQVDGTIIPVGNNLRDELTGQGETLDATRDAAELPEVFQPNLTRDVVFTDVAEGASFENSFGWYNVGDDITSEEGRRRNLHPILGCGAPMQNHDFDPTHVDHHHGNPAFYFQNANTDGDQVGVDFAAEQLAGRYKGGFIGFYLITPERNERSDGNCGDFIEDGGFRFGFIYFTQKDLNNDGDFVHHLVYNSNSEEDRFYFGFEDLFRGGDNDFEDMLIRVDGLTPPCVPTAEVCDGQDNDCDGVVDELDPDLTGVGSTCVCDDATLTCDGGAQLGECQAGQTVCLGGEILCQPVVAPEAEVCDNLDNNCNGTVDDAPTDVGADCDGADADLCAEGQTTCVSGQVVCGDNTGPNQELCNGLDDDCDTFTDESPVDTGGACGTDVGECSPGVEVCTNGDIECQGATAGSGEVCDGLDNDCDANVDEEASDANVPCGDTDEGECTRGVAICSGGGLVCVGETGPTPELCDTLDNDCDSDVDEDAADVGSPCNAPGLCSPGVVVCTTSGPVCEGGTPGSAEVCNGLDDDCNGIVDDAPSDVGGICGGGTGAGACATGTEQCVNGALECVGGADGTTEICNGVDDDCDGVTDEGDLCEGGECTNGTCSSPCSEGEFSCPVGLICEQDFCVPDPCFDVVCPQGEDGERNVCQDGSCLPICDTRPACPGDTVCRPSDGLCVPDNCHYLPLCGDGELCKEEACVPDPCLDVTCPESQFCREGACIASCAEVTCEAGEECRDGACEPTGCAVSCPDGRVCSDGACVRSPCTGRNCPAGQACEPQSGTCVSDPCIGVVCPQGQTCELGDCFAPMSEPLPARQRVTVGGSGCSAAGGQAGGWAWMALATLGLVLRRRGMRGVRATRRLRTTRGLRAAALASLLALGLTSCSFDSYCIDCETESDGGAGGTGDGGGMEPTDGGGGVNGDGGGGSSSCDMGITQPETCNDADDDCDGTVDEDFDLSADVMNCGACGADCLLPGARTACEQSQCAFLGCFAGYVDVDQDPANGCEYSCFASNGGEEACDRLDNDCDGVTDEGFDLSTNENCGACGQICSRFQANATCVSGTCTFDPATDCNPGFHDLNGTPADGCEYACTVSNGGVEICDLQDNDCNGVVDDGFDLQSDTANCGACGRVCNILNATPTCTSGTCTYDPATDCNPGFHDANGSTLDGCEYACTVSNGGVEICDLQDNDCNGQVDDSPVDAGASCNQAPGGVATGECTDTGTVVCSLGTLVCAGAPEPQLEICDNLDNDCDGVIDDGVTRACYSGPDGTEGVGACSGGFEQCVAGSFTGICEDEVTPAGAESCNAVDDDCDGQTDEAAGGGLLTQTCYSGTPGTEGVGICLAGVETCTFGVFGACEGEVVDEPTDLCGDALDTDCDGLDDTTEGCLAIEPGELRLDQGNAGDPLGTDAGDEHSFDLSIAAGGTPLGSRVYAVWSNLTEDVDGDVIESEIYFRRSSDGGITWSDIANLTSGIGVAAVKPLVVVAPGAAAGGEDGVHVVFQTVEDGVRDILVRSSGDSGANFAAATARLDSDADADAFHHHAAVSADGATLVVVWESLDTDSLTRDIHSSTSTDGGGSFPATPRTINVGSGGEPVAGRPQVGITSAGRFVYVWRETRGGTTPDIFAAFSDDPTAAIAADERLDGDGGDTRNSDFPQLAIAGQNIYVTWQDISTQPGGGSDVVFARSTDNGASYQSELVIDDPGGEVSASFTPTIAIDPRTTSDTDDRVFIAWEDRRQGTQIFTAASSNAGASFATAVRASAANGDPIVGVTRDPRIAHAGGDAVVLAYVNDEGTGVERLFVTSSIDAGQTWQLTHDGVDLGTGQALQPAVIPVTGGLTTAALVSWVDFRADTQINGDPYVRRTGR